jgi:predicted RNase H-like HicB family nuclease
MRAQALCPQSCFGIPVLVCCRCMSDVEITLTVTPAEEGGFVATWDDPRGGGISTQGDDLRELQHMVCDAVEGYFRAAGSPPPRNVRLHFVEDPALSIA